MLNPDGVFLGNYRCSCMGYDLNRHWVDPDQWGQPEILAVKDLIMQYHQDPEVDLDFVIDIHAHSVATNGFMYCNVVQEGTDPELAERESVFPRLLDKVRRIY
jgi:murein tripeptide amidase MpaA